MNRHPRLVTRFALSSLAAFVAIGFVLALVVSGQLRGREEHAATDHAMFVARSILRYELTHDDVLGPMDVDGARYHELAAVVRSRLLKPPVVRVKLWGPDGTVVFSDEPRLVGMNFGLEPDIVEGFAGEVTSEVSDLDEEENIFEREQFDKLFQTYVPVYLPGTSDVEPADAVAELYTDYAGIQGQVNHLFGTLVITLVLGLAALYLLVMPLTRRVAKTLSSQNQRLAEQAEQLQGMLEREQRSVAELTELNELKDEFVAMASHEVRTPLTSIVGYAKTLRRPGFSDDPAVREEFLEAIERQGDRLSRLVENLLASSRIEDERGRLRLAPVAIADVVTEVISALGPRGRRVAIDLSQKLPTLATDRQRLELILINLLDNALKFSSPGRSCELTAQREGDFIALAVRDHGIGIPAEHLERIFDRFYQVDSSVTRGYGGVGLGLSLVKELAASLGGTVDVSSLPGQGSTFVVNIPIISPQGDDGWAGESREAAPAASR